MNDYPSSEWVITVCPECGAQESSPPSNCDYCERGGRLIRVVVVEKPQGPRDG